MEGFRQYILSVVCAAVFCGILGSTGSKNNTRMLKLTSGIFLALVAIRPLADIRLTDLPAFAEHYSAEAEAAVADGKNIAAEASAALIKDQVEAYILDKAESLGVTLTVNVTLDENSIPVSVSLSGPVSPSAKSRMQAILENDLGIPKEEQKWTD